MTPLAPLGSLACAARAQAGLGPSAALNDAFRRSFSGGQVMLTAGVAALDPPDRLAVIDAVRTFDAFTAGCDPYGEHDLGRFLFEGTDCYWKIDYYNHDLSAGSEDPADPFKTTRVLTIMRVDER